MSEVARMHVGWFHVSWKLTQYPWYLGSWIHTHTGEHRACGNTLFLSGFTDVGYQTAGKRKLTSLTILLIFRAFFKVRLSSDVRLWKCEVPFILFKSFLYFSCKRILVWHLNKRLCCQLMAQLWPPRCSPFTPQKSDQSHDCIILNLRSGEGTPQICQYSHRWRFPGPSLQDNNQEWSSLGSCLCPADAQTPQYRKSAEKITFTE